MRANGIQVKAEDEVIKRIAQYRWSTLNREGAERISRLGSTSIESDVDAVTLFSLVEEFGKPYYAKIDLEGNDLIAVES